MPRATLIRTSEFPYHVTNRSNNKDYFYVDLPLLWSFFIDCFKAIREQYDCRIHAFVLMSNHYHLLITTPGANLDEAMLYLHREVARKANRRSRRINHFFGTRYKWSVVNDQDYYWNSVKYIFQNPTRAKICTSVYQYEFSSLNKPTCFEWEMCDPFNPHAGIVSLDSSWLDCHFEDDDVSAIRTAVRRRTFQLPKVSNKSWILDRSPHSFKSETVR